MDKLTKQDQEFVKEVAVTGNQTQAAKKAYGITSDKYAGKKGSLLVANGSINTAIAEVKRSLAERIPDDLVNEKHLALLNKKEMKRTFNAEIGEWIEVATGDVDTQAVSKGLDMAYKLKGSYAPDKTINLNLEADITNPKARELAEKYENELKKNL